MRLFRQFLALTRASRTLRALVWLGFWIGATGLSWGAEYQSADPATRFMPPKPASAKKPTSTVGQPTDLLEKVWPNYPEWLAMVAEILAGNRPTPGAGWYRKGISKTRFDWNRISTALDQDQNGEISSLECPGSLADFKRLDRNHDGKLTAVDFDFSSKSRKRGKAAEAFSFEPFVSADRDSNYRISRSEYGALKGAFAIDPYYGAFLASIAGELENRLDLSIMEDGGYLTYADFQEAFDLAAKLGTLPDLSMINQRNPAKFKSEIFLPSFLKRELGEWGPGPELNDPAPQFALKSPTGGEEVSLTELNRSKPVVLIFGNFTCGPFRAHATSLDVLFRRYKNDANFVVIYSREAHPADGGLIPDDIPAGVLLDQPHEYQDRLKIAQTCQKTLGLKMPMLVDGIDDAVSKAYSGLPSRLYLIDAHGRIAYKGGRGPFGFKPAELEQSLILLLHTEPGPAD